VLIAEDDGVTRLLLQHWLQSWGFEVTAVRDGNEAWEALERRPSPKLVVMDWMMPGIDGIELCRRLRSQSEYYRYILMITARTDMVHVVHALESGADDCIAKPIEEHELRARIRAASRILTLQDELIQAREEIREQAMKDSLTGLWNRAAFKELFELELDRAARINGQTGLLLLDLDHFKQINDRFGHMTGDIVLRKTARLLKQNVRSYDFVGRFGGEEFLVAFPGCDEKKIRRHAERIRGAVANNPIRINATEIAVTLSIGAAVSTPGQRQLADIMAVADVALYRAKQSGRNCSVSCHRLLEEILVNQTAPHACCATCDPVKATACIVPGTPACIVPGASAGSQIQITRSMD
jgi:diguanylate cyclase (GGDEF)-like protein